MRGLQMIHSSVLQPLLQLTIHSLVLQLLLHLTIQSLVLRSLLQLARPFSLAMTTSLSPRSPPILISSASTTVGALGLIGPFNPRCLSKYKIKRLFSRPSKIASINSYALSAWCSKQLRQCASHAPS